MSERLLLVIPSDGMCEDITFLVPEDMDPDEAQDFAEQIIETVRDEYDPDNPYSLSSSIIEMMDGAGFDMISGSIITTPYDD